MKKVVGLIPLIIIMISCASSGEQPFQPTVDYVDMERFMGDWYVIGLIPTVFEKDIANGVENYSRRENGEIRVRYSFRKKSPQGKEKVMFQRGWIVDSATNAEWEVSPLWPLRLPYYVLELGENYDYTVIGTNNFDYLWIMSRTPSIEESLLEDIIRRMEKRGYDRERILFMDQVWKE
ncbi:MAG: lipocalin family protein [Spirochaetales bacterium]|nr:lipocalin family protein [Spirochaetales bacterium]